MSIITFGKVRELFPNRNVRIVRTEQLCRQARSWTVTDTFFIFFHSFYLLEEKTYHLQILNARQEQDKISETLITVHKTERHTFKTRTSLRAFHKICKIDTTYCSSER